MRYLKKFESSSSEDEILEYFIDMDKNHGGDWDVDVISSFGPSVDSFEFNKIQIVSRSDFDLDEMFLEELSKRVDRVLSIGDFILHNGSRKGVGDPNTRDGNFGFFFLDLYKMGNVDIPYGIPIHPVVEIDYSTINNIKLIKKGILDESYRQRGGVYRRSEEMDNVGISLGSLCLWFKELK